MTTESDFNSATDQNTPQTFENAMQQLEAIVREMESGNAALETMIAKFEQGTKLARFCRAKLDKMEEKISVLLADDGESGEWSEFDPTTSRSISAVAVAPESTPAPAASRARKVRQVAPPPAAAPQNDVAEDAHVTSIDNPDLPF